jgi:hypothetical protein
LKGSTYECFCADVWGRMRVGAVWRVCSEKMKQKRVNVHPLMSLPILANPPQQNKAPPAFRPHVKKSPAVTANQVPSPETATGTAVSVVFPSPSCPRLLDPANGCTGGGEPCPGQTVGVNGEANVCRESRGDAVCGGGGLGASMLAVHGRVSLRGVREGTGVLTQSPAPDPPSLSDPNPDCNPNIEVNYTYIQPFSSA